MISDNILDNLDNPVPITIKAKVIEKEDGNYKNYIFADLDSPGDYYLITQYPNWEQKTINIDDIGYLTFYIIIAGKSKYFENKNIEIPSFSYYKYTHLALVKFIKTTSDIVKKEGEKFKIKIV